VSWSHSPTAAVIAALAMSATGAAATTTAATAGPAPNAATVASAANASCRSYPRPGTLAAAPAPAPAPAPVPVPVPVPALVLAEYGALRRPRRRSDQVAESRLGRLPESGILAAQIRMLGTVPAGGRVYLVPSLHLLAAPMRPVRCVAPAERARQASLLVTLRREYARRGLCVVIVYPRGAIDNCAAASGTVAALLHGPRAPAFGSRRTGSTRSRSASAASSTRRGRPSCMATSGGCR
jgi:hypothetical protein